MIFQIRGKRNKKESFLRSRNPHATQEKKEKRKNFVLLSLTSPGIVMMSEMPRTPWRRTSSATRKASVTGREASTASRRLSKKKIEKEFFFFFFGGGKIFRGCENNDSNVFFLGPRPVSFSIVFHPSSFSLSLSLSFFSFTNSSKAKHKKYQLTGRWG